MELLNRRTLKYASGRYLLSIHRQICSLRGWGWNSAPYPIFSKGLTALAVYHSSIVWELYRRNKCPNMDMNWLDPRYRGKNHTPTDYCSSHALKQAQSHRHPAESSYLKSIYILYKKGEFK